MKRKTILPYNPILKNLARELRKNGTLSEVLLWRHIKSKQLLEYDFDRQKPIGNFIVDFFCNELMLAIEIDGESHNYKIWQDRERQKMLEGAGVRFLRFTDEDVKQNIEGVVGVIERWVRENQANIEAVRPTPNPSQEGTFEKPNPSQEGTFKRLYPFQKETHGNE